MSRVELRHRRILIDGRPRLMLAGEIHYFRLDRADWADRLSALRDAGCDTLATYIPWVWHEKPSGEIDLSDAADFLDLAHEMGLWVIARPGPYVMAELKNEGIPSRLARDMPELVPTTWDGSPVPNAALDLTAPAFLSEVDGWYAQVMPMLAARLADRGGPVVAVQLDNEVGMLPWITNAPPNGKPVSLAEHVEFSRSVRADYASYLSSLRSMASRHGVRDVPFLINVHGTDQGRARTFGIGLSQLRDAYHGVPGVACGTDLYLGDLTVGNLPDLYVANAFTAATNGPDQPLMSLEFECGSGDYGQDMSTLIPPSAVELTTRLAVAQGNRLLNYYLFAGGHNPSSSADAVPGTSVIAITGKRHGYAAPVGPSGERTAGYGAISRVAAALRPCADLLAGADPEYDDIALGLVRDHYLTEFRNPSSRDRLAQVTGLSRFRGMGPRDVLARGLLLGGYTYAAVDLQASSGALPRVVALGSPAWLGASVQRRLAEHVLGGGGLLLHGVVPVMEYDGTPCTILADALGVRPGRLLEASHTYFTSVVGAGRPEVRVGYAQLLSAPAEPLQSGRGESLSSGSGESSLSGLGGLLSSGSGEPLRLGSGESLSSGSGESLVAGSGEPSLPVRGEPLLREVGSGEPCAYRLTAGAGRAVVIAADYACDVSFWREQATWLGATPALRPTPDAPGVIAMASSTPSGDRVIHALNVSPTPATFDLNGVPAKLTLPARSAVTLPAGVPVDGGRVLASTCEMLGDMAFRPTQTTDVIVLDTTRQVEPSRGEVSTDGNRVTIRVTGPDPVHLTLR